MKLKQLRTLPLTLPLVIALVFPVLADAQIYKWKDKNGVTRYSVTRPTDTLKVDGIGGECSQAKSNYSRANC